MLSSKNNNAKLSQLLDEYQKIFDRLEMTNVESPSRYTDLYNLSIKIINHVVKSTALKRRIHDMGGKVLMLQSEKLLAKGEAKGRVEEIYASVQAGDYSIARGAEKLGITIETFEKRMTEAGYKLPVSV